MPDTKKLVGARLKELRRRTGLTQEQLADAVGLDARHLSRLEVGRHFPSLDSLDKIATQLNVPLGEFFQFPNEESTDTLRAFLTSFSNSASDSQIRLAVKAIRMLTV